MWFAVLLLLPLLLYWYNSWSFGYWRRRGVFQVEGKFLFGNILDVLRMKSSLQVLCSDLYKKYKEKRLIGFYSFYRPIVLVTDPELVKQVLITDFNNYSSPGFEVDEKLDPMLALNPFGTNDIESWKERRGMHVSVHTPAKLKHVPQALLKVGHDMVNFITSSEQQTVSVKDLSEFFTMNSVVGSEWRLHLTQNIFRKNAKDIFATTVKDLSEFFTMDSVVGSEWRLQHTQNIFRKNAKDIFATTVKDLSEFFTMDSVVGSGLGMEASAYKDPQNIFRKNAKDGLFATTVDNAFHCAYLYPFVAKLFAIKTLSTDSLEFFKSLTPQLLNQRERNPLPRGDIIDAILKTDKKRMSEGKKGFDEIEKTAHIVAAYLDSYFTTSVVLRGFILELVSHPEEQEKLREEILAAGKKIEDFDSDVINSLKYLQATLNETLRLHVVLAIIARKCFKRTELAGITIEEGTKLLIPAKDLHMDPDYYPDPEKFLPERFDTEVTKGTFLPFGDGPRMCLGNRYAQIVMKLAIINMLLKFRMLPGKSEEENNAQGGTAVFHQPEDNITIKFQSL